MLVTVAVCIVLAFFSGVIISVFERSKKPKTEEEIRIEFIRKMIKSRKDY